MSEQKHTFRLNTSHAYDFLRGIGELGEDETTGQEEVKKRIRSAIREKFLGEGAEDIVLTESGELEITPEKFREVYLSLRSEDLPNPDQEKVLFAFRQQMDTYITGIKNSLNVIVLDKEMSERAIQRYGTLMDTVTLLSKDASFMHIIVDELPTDLAIAQTAVEQLEEELKQMLENGVLRNSPEYTQLRNQWLVVKASETTCSSCIDLESRSIDWLRRTKQMIEESSQETSPLYQLYASNQEKADQALESINSLLNR